MKKSFTLIELIVIATIILILAAVIKSDIFLTVEKASASQGITSLN